MDIKKQIGLRIKELRITKGLKQAELAELVNIATKHQSCVETGKNFPSADLLEKYANTFKVELSDLLNIGFIKSRCDMEIELLNFIKSAKDDQIKLLYRIFKSIFM